MGKYLTIDIGNTTTTLAISEESRITEHIRLKSDVNLTEVDYLKILENEFNSSSLTKKNVKSTIIASVVPQLTNIISKAIEDLLNITPIILTNETPTGLVLKYSNPQEIGADRLANALALRELYPLPAIGVDLGTATTYDVVSKDGEYLGGVISPGLETSAHNLFKRASLLKTTELKLPERVIGQSTNEAVRTGILYQTAKAVDGIVDEIERELGEKTTVILTGGYAELVDKISTVVDEIDPYLTHRGLIIALEIVEERME
jgi:type III pantothenate kinase